MPVCRDCLYWHRKKNPEAKKTNGRWPQSIYYEGRGGYCDEHASARAAQKAKRRAAKMQQMPKWANGQKIKTLYAQARVRTKQTGIRHEVDHVIPLQGKTVRGLHVEENLRVITRVENAKKSNRF
jgi:hypothetical protein